MNAPLRQPWTQEQFFAWASTQERRYEFDGFQPVAMTGGTNGASAIGVNLITALHGRLRNSGCRPLGPDAGIETVNTAIRYPDALVTCSRFDPQGQKVPGVVVVFEVVSPNSSRIDRIVKVREYAAVPSIRRYVILESSSVDLTVMERETADQTWRTTVLTGEDILRMPEIGIEIPVSEIYEGLAFPDQEEATA
ncbi:MAG TPA: Uma2 family endonuclease [Rhodopila sp.]|uniref:Uma2 family endonuclease n=1 Tax=Rhodopila sp. TaxID=2480087 RepID=UPI002C738D83|nr:Uma2 family endonuclease [Rhodopila sp.]HVY13607.1 Uma2 family endonuclease [Rhodopila sp.]